MDDADSPRPGLLKRLWQYWTQRRSIDQPEDIEKEIQTIIGEGEERGFISRQEGQMIESIFKFKDTLVKEIMVPRVDMTCVAHDAPIKEIIGIILARGHSRLPVYQGDIDHIVGILLAKDLLVFWDVTDAELDLSRVLRAPFFIPESKKISDLLRDFVEKKAQIAIVIDEYGGTSGLITIEDILEEIVGEIYDEYDFEEPRLVAQEDQSVIVDARLDIEELAAYFDIPCPEGEFESVGGLLIHHLGRVPKVNDQVKVNNLEFQVVAADDRRVKKIRVQPLTPAVSENLSIQS
ncbi:MAG: HlyC/CorC family transporter [Deltaproteobacteria bacterium]|nr:HlyC/CorC family transporter [Deltaproteobacteria bacterium]MBW1952763.1 HlyC/CorC family transporter [Deltaproteobacteria bacterium]MBW2135372.1 HlyC/CorC family transporter [Deltaproteobacteria bacterium]